MKCRDRIEPVGSIRDSGCFVMTNFTNSPSPASIRTPLGLHPGQPMPRLYDRLIEVLRTAHYSRRTEEAYVGWIRRFIQFHGGRHPALLGAADVTAFLSHLAVNGDVAASTQN